MKNVIVTVVFLCLLNVNGLFAQQVDVISPNGGETLTVGSSFTIQWASYGSSFLVDLYYSTDGGTTWVFINDNLPHTGTYTWTVPNVSSSTCLVKADAQYYVDQSNSYFSIVVGNTLTLTYPNGGEVLSSGTLQNVSWTFTGSISYLALYYSTDLGSNWTYIDVVSNTSPYQWMVPSVNTATAMFKIENTSNPVEFDVSDAPFQIGVVASNPVTVTYPNGGEVLQGSGSYDITWSSDGSITWLDLYYSTDGGSNWVFIADHETNDGSYTWTAPNIATQNAKIMITEFSNSNIYDISDSAFTINAVANSVTVISPNGAEFLSIGSTYNITWSSTGSISYVEIWYSTDGGMLWYYIDDYSFNDGSYQWAVPNIPTVNALIKINEVFNTSVSDVSDNVFAIGTISNSVTVTSPNGGEVLTPGTSHYITWSSTGSISDVEIYLSVDSGSTWSYIDDYAFNDGIYEWTVPNVSTSTALLRINDVSNASTYDISDATFVISSVISSGITVLTPNGGDTLYGGSNYTITWSWAGTFIYAEIYYSTDGGTTWAYVDDFTANDGIYVWNVINTQTNNALIKVQEAGNASVFDVSDSPFTINAITNSIYVSSPNGGEVLTSGTTHNITWSANGIINYVEIWWSDDGGMSWMYIDDYAFNDGVFEWYVPSLITTTALVKINDVANASTVDISNAVFEITAPVTSPIVITYPNGGETLSGGSTYDITWNSNGTVTWLDLYYSTNNGSTWTFIADHEANDGTFTWNAANVTTSNALIMITEFSNTNIYDISDAVFSINAVPNTVTVISPNGGETLYSGTVHNITWSTTGTFTYGAVEVWYSTDGGNIWTYIDDYAQNDGQLEWTVPNIASVNALIKINEVYNTSVVDVSDAAFEINPVAPSSITVLTPNGFENLNGGDSYNITWETTGNISYVEIWYSTNGGYNWTYIDDYSPNDSSYTWNVVNTNTSSALIKINDVANSAFADVSDNMFTINYVPDNITVLSPNGGELLSAGATYDITWSSTGSISYVEIWYSLNGGALWTYIDDYTINDGSYLWTVPNVTTVNALVRIDGYNTSVMDVSNSAFEITQVISNPVTVTYPNGGESLSGGSTYDITWSSDGSITWLDLYYSTDGGSNWIFIADHEANDGSYNWTAPNITTQNAKIMITEFSNTNIYDLSDSTFSITAVMNSVTVISPNGGEVLIGGSTHSITWTTTGTINFLEIWYSPDGGIDWFYIDDYAWNDSLLEWTVPNINTTSALVKINELYNTLVVDVSNAVFTINAIPNTITILTPNGGENLSVGATHDITWSSTGTISYVEIWYSANNGSSWTYIDDYSVNDGLYEWTVPNTITTTALVKINDLNNTSVVDVSDSTFEIAAASPFTVITPNGGEVLTGGNTYTITWSTSGYSGNYVGILYSTDGGNTWATVDDFKFNNGFKEWTVANVSTTNALIKVHEVFNAANGDVSDAPFTINAVINTITITSPNGGEILTGGSTHNITWTSTGLINYVEIWYSTDNGSVWNYIDDYSANDGLYEWTVTNVSTVNALVKINEVYNISVLDVSDSTFEINAVVPITIISPNGGETIAGGSTYDITWISDGSFSYVDLYYSTDGGNNWAIIADHEDNDSIYSWIVPNVTTSTAMIAITEFNSSGTYDFSDANFTINAVANSITVLSPNGGETWTAGTTQDVTWSSTGAINYVEIWYSSDGGQVWTYIDDYSPNDGLYEWSVPNISTVNALIKINEVFNTSIVDVSDANFEINQVVSNPVTIITPNGGETLTGGSPYNITWTSDQTITWLDLYYSTDGGSTWLFIADHEANDSSYIWMVPNISSTNALIKITEFSNASTFDVSDAVFSINAIANSVTVVSPNGGEVWVAGSSQDITWTSTGSINYVEIWYSTNGGTNWTYIDDYSANDGLYEWTVPSFATVNALIKINEVFNASVFDVSDSAFEITVPTPNTITISTPNGGENLSAGSNYFITWTNTGQIDYVEIWFSSDGGSNWSYIDDHAFNAGIHEWTVPNTITTNALIRINEFGNSSVVDVCDSIFEISTAVNSLTLTHPNGGELLTISATYYVVWESIGNISHVDLSYSTDSGATWDSIASNVPNNGLHSWEIPNAPTSNALVKVVETGNSSVADESDSTFTITSSFYSSLMILAPNGGEVITGGSTYEITWWSVGMIPYVSLFYSVDNGINWIVIDTYLGSNGPYSWNVPNINSQDVLIRIENQFDPSMGDNSNNVFSISSPSGNSLTVTQPDGGEVLTTGSSVDITWTSTGSISNVDILYSIDGGSNWSVITTNTVNDGIYTWQVPNDTTSTALISIRDAGNVNTYDESNSTFTITQTGPSITITSPNGGEVWPGGSSQNITWTSNGSITHVQVAYSLNGGQTWIYLSVYQQNSGSHSWTVPYVNSSTALVKVNDVFNQNTADISNNTFVIGSLPAQITILSPNGGETWAGGSTQNISWTSIGAIPYVEIWYSPDGGLVWTYLDDYAVNDGLFEWTVPNISTTTAVVKINDVSYPYVVDYSDAAFEISSSVNNTVTVLAPNGGEVLAGGTNYDILWTSTGTIAEVDIYYSLDGGSNWSFVANNTNNDGSYTWLVSNLPTTNALIAIIDSNNPIITDTSDSSFTISAIAQTISVISPNGGEVWEIGSTQNITWSTTGQVLYVKIWYSTDGGSNWTNIAPYNPNSGSYAWTVPNATTTDALIKITDVNNISVADVSDTTFEIGATLPNSITVLTPNGGEILNGGSYLNITWSSTGTISYVEIWYSTNGGTSWTYVDDYSPNDGQHGWTVANVNTSDALIKIHEVFAPSNGDTSDSTFTINAVTNSVTVISPNGGEVLTAGTTHIIQWSWTGTFTYGAVEIWYSTDGGNLWNYINDYATNIGQYAWTVPNIPSSSALIKINEVYNSTVVDISDSTFEIMGAAPNSITVLTPNGGEVLTGGSNYDITWSSTGSINYVEIYYSTNGGSTWTYIDDYSPNDGIHTWNVENVSTTNALIKIHEIFNSTVNDLSDSTFTINAVPNSLTLVAPNGGETWTVGSIQDITWSSTGTVNYVDISLSIDSGINWFYIGEYQYNDGHFEWTVLNNPSTTAMIKINDVYNTTVTDVGDSIFTIQPATPASITINYPNGGEVITANDWSYISWTSSGITGNVMIHYSIDNGTNWVMLNDNVQNSGGYQYIVPNVSNTACLIKVQELGGSTILDVSDSVFTIQPAIPASITINYPNGGEIITNNDWSYISWTSSGITGNVMIHYSIDNGTNWVMLNDNVQNSGGYQYIVPNVTSTACLIKVQELGGSTVLDVSDSVFTIGPSVTNSLTVLTPNGGDTLIEGNVYNITWSSTGTIGLIDLYYSSDNGVTWNFIDDNLQNTGPYAWTVPSVASTQCLLKVQSGAVEDLSDAVFTIQILTVPGTGLLLAQYYFNEGTANDDIGNIDGQRNDLELVSDRFGCPNHAFKFGPSNGYINLGDTLDEVFAAPDSSFAFSVWIKKTSNFAYGTIIAKNAGNYCGLNGRQFNLKLQSNGKIRFVFASTLNYQILETMETIGTVSDLNWHHVAFNYDGSINTSGPDRVEIYIDNQLQSVNTVNSYGNMSDIQNGDAQLSIGSEVDATGGSCGTNFFNGSLDDIRIYAGNLSSSDVAGLFNETLTCPVNALTITSPNSSISFNEGASHTITWNSIGQVSNVDLYYSSDGGDNFTSIATNISNTGIYAWTVPSVASANCLIRIEETGNPVVIDESDATFTIVQNTLTVDVPNGGQNWDGLSNHNIWWIKTGNIPMVDLYYTIDNGTTWTLIADNLSSTYHTWSVPNVSSVMCKIKVVQTGNPAVADESDNTFTINYIAPELTLTSHNSGQTLNGGNNSYIYWQSAGGVGDINIYFYEDSSPFWNLLSGNESNDGSYAWTVPNINAYNVNVFYAKSGRKL